MVIDMNLSPEWVQVMAEAGIQAQHWSMIGAPSAKDREIMDWARRGGWVVFTHDLDFGALLAHAATDGPSVVQVRALFPDPLVLGAMVVSNLRRFAVELATGAILTILPDSARVRLLPIARPEAGPSATG